MHMPLALSGVATETVRDRFERLLRPEFDHAYQLAGYLLGEAAEAEDAAGEAVARAWSGFEGLRDEERFGPWLTRILVNVCRDRLRRRRSSRSCRSATTSPRRPIRSLRRWHVTPSVGHCGSSAPTSAPSSCCTTGTSAPWSR